MKRWTLSTLAVLVSVASVMRVFRADAPAEDAPSTENPHRAEYDISDPRWGATYASTGAMTNFTDVMRRVLEHVKKTREAHGYGVWDARVFIPRGRYEADGTLDVIGMKG